MANDADRVPKEGDRVRTPNVKDGFVVVAVRENPNVVDLDLPNGPLRIKNIPWAMLTFWTGNNRLWCTPRMIFSVAQLAFGSLRFVCSARTIVSGPSEAG